ncbi:MAG: cobalamin biosynthesis protein P47K [Clostridiales Family XIII bacterium]|jgi:G3E family GTPase|nr:cobalamin biosynthesis protein P47K [Clostridiales Family XIII bacterium]
MKLIIFSGFLGSGKTVSILSLAKYLSGKNGGRAAAGYGAKAVILENEVGDVNYDQSMLRKSGYEIINMLAGCICCTLSNDLMTQLREFVPWYNPEYVIFEPTGLAYPEAISETAKESGVELEWVRTVTVVDALRYGAIMEMAPKLMEAQIGAADTILLNKIDAADADELAAVRRGIPAINPNAALYEVSAKQGVPDKVFERITR